MQCFRNSFSFEGAGQWSKTHLKKRVNIFPFARRAQPTAKTSAAKPRYLRFSIEKGTTRSAETQRVLAVWGLQIGEAMDPKMSGNKVERKALQLLAAFENAGKPVTRIVIEGRKIELVLSRVQDTDEFDQIDMRHGKT